MSVRPVHVSLEREFLAAVPPRRVPWTRRLSWWLLLRLVAYWPVRALILKRARS